MIVLLIGLICFWAVARAVRSAGVRGVGAPGAGWAVAVGVLVLLQLWSARDEIARYRFSVVGLRYGPAAAAAEPAHAAVRIGGDAESDLYIRGAGSRDVVHLEVSADSTRIVTARLVDDAAGVAVIERRGRFGRRTRALLGGAVIEAGDTVAIGRPGAERRLVVETMPDTVHVAGLGVPLPWTTRHRVRDVATGAVAVLPLSRLGWARRITGRRPTLYARAYPLADVLARLGEEAVPPLTSFFYYDGRSLALADLDSEVRCTGVAEPAVAEAASDAGTAAQATVWHGEGRGDRLLIAALPLRDYPELGLALPERYGVRPLASYRVEAPGDYIDLRYTEPEVRTLDRAELAAVSLPVAPGEQGIVRVRVSHAANSLVREAVVFESPPRAFGAGIEAILLLPEDPSHREMEVLTPAGATRWPAGQPIPLGDGERSTLVRVDGQSASAGFWLLLIALFGMVASVFAVRRPAGVAFTLAILALGFASIRLLLGLSAHLEPPFVQEGHQLGLWLLPVLPWAVIAATDAALARRARRSPSLRTQIVHGAYAAAIAVLTLALFAGSPAKQAVLAAVAVVIGALVPVFGRSRAGAEAHTQAVRTHGTPDGEPAAAGADPSLRSGDTAWTGSRRRRLRSLVQPLRSALPRHGWSIGLALLAGRVALDLIGWREGIELGGTRIAVSVVYTPAVLLALAYLTSGWVARLQAEAPAARRHAFATGLLDIGAFLALAFVAVGFWISDFGIALATAPGALLALAWIGARVVGDAALGRRAALAALVPLMLFAAVQAAPALLAPAWAADAPTAEAARLNDWNRNELLLLERGDPQTLRLIGQRRSEALAVMRETMRSYTRRNWFGRGFLDGRVSPEIQETATREHAVSALLASQWGLAGTTGLVLLLCALFAPAVAAGGAPPAGAARTIGRVALPLLAGFLLAGWLLPAPHGAMLVAVVALAAVAPAVEPALRRRPRATSSSSNHESAEPPSSSFRAHAGALFVLTIACAGLYMVLANYGLVFFTGKNVFLFGLDSVSDTLEGLVLLAGAAALLAMPRPEPDPTHRGAPVRVGPRLSHRPLTAVPRELPREPAAGEPDPAATHAG